MYNYLKHDKKVADLENCDIKKLIEEESFEKQLKQQGLTEIFELGTIMDNSIENVDLGVIEDLWLHLSLIISEYLRLFAKENFKASSPTIYRPALYPNREFNGYPEEYYGNQEELCAWTDLVEETSKRFKNFLGYAPTQDEVNDAFDVLKRIFFGLWFY